MPVPHLIPDTSAVVFAGVSGMSEARATMPGNDRR